MAKKMAKIDKAKISSLAHKLGDSAYFIGVVLTYDYPPDILEAILSAPLQQMEDGVQDIRAFVNAMK